MKTLLLLRHAKSSWDEAGVDDFERPLAPRGRRDAPRMGRALRERGTLPDVVWCSTARRARETLEAFGEAAGLEAKPRFEKDLYGASASEIEAIARKLPDASACALLVGHNPGFEETVERLAGSADSFPTAALACIDFDVERWREVAPKRGKLRWLLKPKALDE